MKRDDLNKRTRRERPSKKDREPDVELSVFDRLEEGFRMRRDDYDGDPEKHHYDLREDQLWDAA